MSFSSNIKERLCKGEFECPMCVFAELAGIIGFGAYIKEKQLRFVTENISVAQRISNDLTQALGCFVKAEQTKGFKINITDALLIDKIKEMLMIGEQYDPDEIYQDLLQLSCCKTSYIKGAFLGGGSVSNPQKAYHIEFDTKSEKASLILQKALSSFDISSKMTKRKERYIVYIKECDVIADVLSLMGAGQGALEFYNVQIEKEMRNAVNRQVNCETANVDKITRASMKQINAINKIKKNMDIKNLPYALYEIAELRLKYPEESLKGLGEKLQPPIGKSGVNHRLNRLIEIANQI